MKGDWRLRNQMKYLKAAKLKKAVFAATETNDHKHCEFCFEKFIRGDSGYCTMDRYRWICEECFQDFRELFAWEVDETPD